MIKYRYAKNKYGKIIDIYNIAMTERYDYTCISCGGKLIPKVGKQRQHHFAHKSNTVNCSKETYLHVLGKKLLYDLLKYRMKYKIPFYVKYVKDICQYFQNVSCLNCKTQEQYNLLEYFQDIYLEKPHGKYVPDILLESKNKENQLFIEIVVTHESSEEKKQNNKLIEIFIEDEEDLHEIFQSGFNEVDKRISLINFKKSISHLECCNINECKNYLGCINTTRKIKLDRINIFQLNTLVGNENIHFIHIKNEDYGSNNVKKYIGNYLKYKNKIKSIQICKYITAQNDYYHFFIIEDKK